MAVQKQLQHATQTALAVDERHRDLELLIEAPGGVRPLARDPKALALVFESRNEVTDVGAHQLGGEMEVAGHENPLDALEP